MHLQTNGEFSTKTYGIESVINNAEWYKISPRAVHGFGRDCTETRRNQY